ncbi:MAG: T9SS type A sorting domain-containing protein [Rhodothermia bacterium]|nr:T9SS type A sorting domain-containing protein [Rhodothermia bacterium]
MSFLSVGYRRGDDDVWLVKTDATGEVMWTTSYSGSSDDVHDLRQTSDGGFVMVGTRNDATTGQDVLVIKTDADGRSVSFVGIADQDELPSGFAVSQNYPNPFNPTTTISYEISSASAVVLSVYDVLGRRVLTLDQGAKPAGSHEVSLDAAGLPSGMYLYRLEAGDYVQARRMVLLR